MLLYSKDADADRAFVRDVLGFGSVDAGRGWLIFALPAAELAVHPAGGDLAPSDAEQCMVRGDLYLMCDDVRACIKALEAKGVRCTGMSEERWGIRTSIVLPSGGQLGLYQPMHPTAIGLR